MLVGFVLQYVGPGEVAKCCWEGCSVCGPRAIARRVPGFFVLGSHERPEWGSPLSGNQFSLSQVHALCLHARVSPGSGHKGRCPEAQVCRACPTCSCTQALTSKAGVALCCRVVSALSCLVLLCLRLAVFNNFCLKCSFELLSVHWACREYETVLLSVESNQKHLILL